LRLPAASFSAWGRESARTGTLEACLYTAKARWLATLFVKAIAQRLATMFVKAIIPNNSFQLGFQTRDLLTRQKDFYEFELPALPQNQCGEFLFFRI
jgi:hypothetical protein